MAGATAVEKVQRDQRIVRERLRKGTSWAALGEKYDLDERSARRIFKDWRDSNASKTLIDLQGRDPIDIVWETAARYETWLTDLGEIAYGDGVEASRVAAINSMALMQERLTKLLQETGILPRQLGRLRIDADIRHVAATILEIFEEEGVTLEVRQRVVAAISSGMTRDDQESLS